MTTPSEKKYKNLPDSLEFLKACSLVKNDDKKSIAEMFTSNIDSIYDYIYRKALVLLYKRRMLLSLVSLLRIKFKSDNDSYVQFEMIHRDFMNRYIFSQFDNKDEFEFQKAMHSKLIGTNLQKYDLDDLDSDYESDMESDSESESEDEGEG